MALTGKISSAENLPSGSIAFADRTVWRVSSYDKNSSEIVSHFIQTMELKESSSQYDKQIIVYTTSDDPLKNDKIRPLLKKHLSEHLNEPYYCEVDFTSNRDILAIQLMKIATIFRQYAEEKKGFLIHGALAVYKNKGVILAGHGGIGKTTASERLPDGWESLCDDTTLVFPDKNGNYMAHPWPTWSRLMFDGSGGTWDVTRKVPVKAVYFLKRDKIDNVTLNNRAEAVCRLVQSAEEALIPIALRDDEYDSNETRINRFNNLCTFAESIPAYTLSFTLNGKFWQEIEKDVSNG